MASNGTFYDVTSALCSEEKCDEIIKHMTRTKRGVDERNMSFFYHHYQNNLKFSDITKPSSKLLETTANSFFGDHEVF